MCALTESPEDSYEVGMSTEANRATRERVCALTESPEDSYEVGMSTEANNRATRERVSFRLDAITPAVM
jgi:hypothetical protein